MTDPSNFIDVHHLARVLGGEKSGPNSVSAPGPNNIDRRNDRSMSITVDPNAPDGFVVYSHSAKNSDIECKDYIRRQLGLPEWQPTKPNSDTAAPKPRPTVVCHYVYHDRDGEPYLRVTRMSDKSFRQSAWEIDGWASHKPSGDPIPYNLPEILARPNDTIHLVEGEKSADYLSSLGLLATTAPAGGGNFPVGNTFGQWFDGQNVRAYPDNDATGRKWAERVAQTVPHAEIIWLPDQPEKSGADDWLQRGGRTVSDLLAASSGISEQPDRAPDEPPRPPVSATPFVWTDPTAIPPREWLLDTHLIRKFVSLTVSPGGLGKSSLALVEAMSLASGRALMADTVIHEPDPCRVWYWNGEDPNDENKRRIAAVAIHYGLTPADLTDRLFIDSGRDQSMVLGQMTRGEIELNEEFFLALESEIASRRIDLFTIDPFVSAHRMGENDNNAIDAVIKRLGKLADRCNCAVEIVHHVRKPSQGSTAQTDVNDARGAGALIGGVRSARVLNVMGEDIATAAGISADVRLRYFAVSDGKANMAPKLAEARWRYLESVCLGNQTDTRKADNVGVVTYYKLPAEARTMADLSRAEDEMRLILSVDDTVRHWPGKGRGQKPKNWLGHRILDALQINDGDHDSAMQKLITGWIKDGKIVTRTAWVDRNRTIFLTLPGDTFTASDAPQNPDDLPF